LRQNLVTRIFRASITSDRELTGYVVATTATCVAIALAVDVTNQLTFFVDWQTCLRSWAITAALVLALAIPISRAVGKANLELYRAKLLADQLGRTDHLTGLSNRRGLMEAVGTANADVLALVIVDIDRFKRVNDTLGHLAGDAVIRTVGRMMAKDLGECGHVARVGGEEFALLSSKVSAEALASNLADFREKVGITPILAAGKVVRVTISAGVAMRRNNETFDQLYSAADRALYAAKRFGRNRVQFADAELPRDLLGDESFEFNAAQSR